MKTTHTKLVKPVSEQGIKKAEKLIGSTFPPLLRAYYSTIANGGVGPFGGLLGLQGGHQDDNGLNALDLVQRWRKLPNNAWPKTLHFIAYSGDTNYFCLDLKKKGSPVFEFDASRLNFEDFKNITRKSVEKALILKAPTFETWLTKNAKSLLNQLLASLDLNTQVRRRS